MVTQKKTTHTTFAPVNRGDSFTLTEQLKETAHLSIILSNHVRVPTWPKPGNVSVSPLSESRKEGTGRCLGNSMNRQDDNRTNSSLKLHPSGHASISYVIKAFFYRESPLNFLATGPSPRICRNLRHYPGMQSVEIRK